MFLFSFELDVLEIALREQQDLVDKIFLVESSATHRGVRIFQNISEYFRLYQFFVTSGSEASLVGNCEVGGEIQFR